MWWSRCEHISRLPDIASLHQWDRFDAEFWIGRTPGACHRSCSFVDKNMYIEEVQPEEYESSSCDELPIEDADTSTMR